MNVSAAPAQHFCGVCKTRASRRVCATCELFAFCSDECERAGARAHRAECKPRAQQTPLDDVFVMAHQITSQIEASVDFKTLVYGLAAMYAVKRRVLCVEVPRRSAEAGAALVWRLSSCAPTRFADSASLSHDLDRFRQRGRAFPVVQTRSLSTPESLAITVIRPLDGSATHTALRAYRTACATMVMAASARDGRTSSSIVRFTANPVHVELEEAAAVTS